MMFCLRLTASALTVTALVLISSRLSAVNVTSGTIMSDKEFFGKLDLARPGLRRVGQAVERNDYAAARHELSAYYRARKGKYFNLAPQQPGHGKPLPGGGVQVRALLDRTGDFDRAFWQGDTFDWNKPQTRFRERMYSFSVFGRAYAATGNENIARAWLNLMRSFVLMCPRSNGGSMWTSMDTGIRMRTSWPDAFHCFIFSPSFSDDDLVLYLKSVFEQTDYIRHHHDPTSNWLTFAMAGLYTSGAMYPEFRDATEWRKYASETAVADMTRGWLPDGMSIELSPGYGQFFSNYYHIYDLAQTVGRLDEFNLQDLIARTETPYACYLKIMAPDRFAPATNDNAPQNVISIMRSAQKRFPQRRDFLWGASEGREGHEPDYTSVVLPYAGFAAMRSGWSRDANMLYFDFGPVGYRHAHQDKLEVILWAYGRQILFDPGRVDYSDSRHSNYALDTFSHNTVLVDNRPQRRIWYQDPSPRDMPYHKRQDCEWETAPDFDYAAGRYEDAYGKPGESDAYPYKEHGNFKEGWSRPATHYRRVFYRKPDIFVIADDLVSREEPLLHCDARWHLDTTHTRVTAGGLGIATADTGRPNLEIVSLFSDGLTTKVTSAQDNPEILGWKIARTSEPATTLQHLKSGRGAVRFVTLLLPLKPGQSGLVEKTDRVDGTRVRVVLADGRKFTISAPSDVKQKLAVVAVASADAGP